MNKKAFTLFETLLVIVIIGILSSIVIVNFKSVRKVKVNNELENLLNDIEHYRNLAVLDGCEYHFNIDRKDNRYFYKIIRIEGLKHNIIKEYEFDNNIIKDIKYNWGNYSKITFKKEATPTIGGSINLDTIDGRYKITIRPGVIKPNLTKE